MNIIISFSKTKRQIDGPFEICGSKEDLFRLADCIVAQVLAHGYINGDGVIDTQSFAYGWVKVTDEPKQPDTLANTKPVQWD